MTREDLKDHLELNDCYVYRQDEAYDGSITYVMRKKGTKLIASVFTPKNNGHYKTYSVCQICCGLEVEVPAFAQQHLEKLEAAKKKLPPQGE